MNSSGMIFPRFSLRWMLLATAVVAVVSIVISRALEGNALALGAVFGLFGAVFLLVFHGLVFVLASLFRMLFVSPAGPVEGSSPFGVSSTPTQVIVPPQDVE